MFMLGHACHVSPASRLKVEQHRAHHHELDATF
jgi:hypothetical protein